MHNQYPAKVLLNRSKLNVSAKAMHNPYGIKDNSINLIIYIVYGKILSPSHTHTEGTYLVLIPFMLSSVSPGRKAKVDGRRRGSAISITLWHCSGVAKLGKYTARGLQLKTYWE